MLEHFREGFEQALDVEEVLSALTDRQRAKVDLESRDPRSWSVSGHLVRRKEKEKVRSAVPIKRKPCVVPVWNGDRRQILTTRQLSRPQRGQGEPDRVDHARSASVSSGASPS